MIPSLPRDTQPVGLDSSLYLLYTTTYYLLAVHYYLLITYYLLLTTYYLLLTTYYLLLRLDSALQAARLQRAPRPLGRIIEHHIRRLVSTSGK